jgi:hypothetical protein
MRGETPALMRVATVEFASRRERDIEEDAR